MTTNKTMNMGAGNFQGFYFLFEPHLENNRCIITNALKNIAQSTLDNITIVNPLLKDKDTKENLVDVALATLQEEYIGSFFNKYLAVIAANKSKSKNILRNTKWYIQNNNCS